MKNLNFGTFAGCFLALSVAFAADARGAGPTEAVKSTVDRVIKILTDPELRGDERKDARRKLLRDTVSPRFDFREMAKLCLGEEWSRHSAEEQEEFVRLFTAFLEKTAVQNIESYDGERFHYTSEKIDGTYAVVDGKILTKEGSEIKISYFLHRAADEEWRAYDLVVDGIGFVGNYRAQFNRLLRQSSYEGLVQRLKEKLAQTSS